jgi:glycyl-tRNA synthetase (class II)
VKNGKFTILNKRYSEDEYKKIRAKIIDELTSKNLYGLFMPQELSPFAYNETIGQDNVPLTKKDGLPELAKELMDECKKSFHCFYEEKDAIGKRYRRQDAIGTPFCVTIDHQTKEDGTVTIRHRDAMTQERIPMSQVKALVQEAINN